MSTFLDTCIEDSLPIWQNCLETEFLRRLSDGTLREDCFKGYIVDDSLYLREYAKVFAWGMLHSTDMEEIRAYHSLLSFLKESEDATRLVYLARWGLTDQAIQPLPLRPENRAYVDYMISAARDGQGAPECMMACLPCMLSYGWIFQNIAETAPQVRDSLFWPLVRDYADPSYKEVCDHWVDFANQVCAGLTPERAARCREIFRQSSLHELRFWEMSAQPRNDV